MLDTEKKEKVRMVRPGDIVRGECEYNVGDLIKFRYIRGNVGEERISYSKVTAILLDLVPEFDDSRERTSRYRVEVHLLMENHRRVELGNVLEVEKRAEDA